MATLIVAEKPDMGSKIAKAILSDGGKKQKGYIEGNGYYITWAVGHLIGIAPPALYDDKYKDWNLEQLPIMPDPFQYIADTSKMKMERIKTIRELASQSNLLVNACDAGREGQYIFGLIYRHLRLHHPVKRLWTNSLTKSGIRKAFDCLKNNNEYEPLFEAADARSKADWLVGINGTRGLSAKHHAKLTIGRVQTPTLAMVYDRAKEIENFQSNTHYDVIATFTQESENYEGKWEGSGVIKDAQQATQLAMSVKEKPGKIIDYKIKKGKESAPKLFDLSALQSEANKVYGYTLQQTLNIAQSLYEKHEAITYPRTDSRYVTKEEIPLMHDVFDLIKPRFQKMKLPGVELAKKEVITENCKRVCRPDKVTDHHAIFPTEKVPTGNLTNDEQQIYVMIARRFFLQFFPAARFQEHHITTDVSGHSFKTMIKEWEDKGWRTTLSKQRDEEEDTEEREGVHLTPDKAVQCAKTEIKKRVSKPPKPYTEGTLVKAMEVAGKELDDEDMRDAMKGTGLGTPATRASIVERLKDIGYINGQKKLIEITPKGRILIEMLKSTRIRTLTSPELTGEWEQKLHAIAKGDGRKDAFLGSIEPFTSLMVEEIKNMERQDVGVVDALTDCPSCKQGKIVDTKKAFGCTRWKDGCHFKIWKTTFGKKTVTKKQCVDLIEHGKTSVLKFKSKAGKEYKARLKIKDINEGTLELEFMNRSTNTEMKNEEKQEQIRCPKCKEGYVTNREKLYGCSNYPNCDFRIIKNVSGKELNKKMVFALIEGKETPLIKGFISKSGKKYNAYLKLNESCSLQFRFPDKNR
ncbi:DNA topoisomerase 3 [Bacillus piscicola]|uniref:DNA topoisomerase 3 n=1 Tax=Bacillus piscicola TaxID=1632684 RepID=UPI001F088C8C|nr:DNA topoisomerase 3 [Bacillus piscicola]